MDRHRAYRSITRAVLGEYLDRKASLSTLPERIATERARLTAIRSSSAESQMISGGGGNVRQERDTAILAEIDRLTNALDEAQREVELIERCLAQLTKEQRKTLGLMDINRRYGAVEELCNLLGYERSRVYDIHNDALDRFAILYHGAR